MNPVKLLASRNILIGAAIVAVVFVLFAVFQSQNASLETLPSADRIGPPPEATGEVVPLDTILTAFQQKGAAGVRRYRNSPFSARVDAISPVKTNGWVATAKINGGHAVAYFADRPWQAIDPPLAPGQTRTLTCADWTTDAGTVTLYGCGVTASR